MRALALARPGPAAGEPALALVDLALALVLGLGPGLGPAPAQGSRVAGPYVAYAERMYPCDERDSTNKMIIEIQPSKFDVRRPNSLQTLSGNVTISMKDGLDDNLWTRARMDARSTLKWVPNAFNFNFRDKACSNLRMHMPGFFSILMKKELKPTEPCVVPAGSYVVDNEPVNWTFPKFPVMPFGTWKFNIQVGYGRETFGCHSTECRTVPRGHQ